MARFSLSKIYQPNQLSMIKRLVICLSFYLICEHCTLAMPTDIDDLGLYFSELKELNYKSAADYAKQFDNGLLRNKSIQLTEILYAAGQSKIQIENEAEYDKPEVQIISLFIQGYHNLYTNPYSNQPFRYFSEALAKAREIDLLPAQKFALISILEVYSFEISQSNEDAQSYLQRLKELAEDNADLYHYYLNALQLDLKDIFLDINIDLSFFQQFDKVMNQYQSNHPFWPNYYSFKGVFYEKIDRVEEAISFHKKSIASIKDEPFLKFIKFRSNIRLSEINRKRGSFEEALIYMNEADLNIDLADTTRSKFYIHYYLSRVYDQMNDHEKAYSSLLRATDLKTKLDYEQNSLEIARLNVRYQTQEKELALLKEREKVRDTRNMLGGSVLLIVFISITYYLVQKNTKRKQLLAESEKDLERQRVVSLLKEQELVSIDAMIAGQEKERQRLANELHDDLGGLLASIKLHFHTLLYTEDTESNKKFEKTDSLINEAYDKVRAIAHAKNSGVIAKEGFLRSLEEMADKISIANNLTVTVIEHGLDERLENSIELSLFRIIQELITNVIRHSNATEANIHLTKHDDTLNIMVEDNGDGFDSSGITLKSGGMGIKSIDKRVAFLNGSMNIESEVGQGTTVIIEIPL